MYAVICTPQYWKLLEDAINSTGDEILLKTIDNDVEISTELVKYSRVAIKYLIIDISAVLNPQKLVSALRQYKIMHDRTQIIIIAPNCVPGDELIYSLVTQVHMYDIIAPTENSSEDFITTSLLEYIKEPSTFKRGVRWVVYDDEMSEGEQLHTSNNSKSSNRPKPSNQKELDKRIEKQIEREIIFKEKIIGSVLIAVATTSPGLGGTLFSLAASFYLVSKNFKVAILELKSTKSMEFLNTTLKTSEGPNGSINIGGVDIYPYKESDDLFSDLKNDYDYVLLDIGTLVSIDKNESETKIKRNTFFTEMYRADLSVLITSAAPWRLNDFEIYKNFVKKNWRIIANLAQKDDYHDFKKLLDNNAVIQLPYLDPFDLKDENVNTLNNILKPILPKDLSIPRKSNKFFGLFK